MRLNHLDLHVPDVAATCDFFVGFFGLTLVETRGAQGLAILQDEAGLELVISRPVVKFGGADTPTVGMNTYHVGFILPTRGDVDALYDSLVSANAQVIAAPSAIRGGWLFYCYAPGRILVEVVCRQPVP